MSVNDHILFAIAPSSDFERRARMAVCCCGYETPAAGTTERLLELWASHVVLKMCEQLTGSIGAWSREMVRVR